MKCVTAWLLVLLAASLPVRAEPDPAPYAAMRTLQALQEQVAHGNATAQSAQPKLMAHIADGFLSADPKVWSEPRNARAAVLFLLSGGKPAVVRSVLETAKFPPTLDRLMKGALAFGEAQDEIARSLLDGVEPQSLPTDLGAHVALVRATLSVDVDRNKAIRLFDTARLLAPGTLIEEAALRHEVFVLTDADVIDKAMLLARQYFRRFRTSVYAEDFRQRFASAAVKMATAGNVAELAQLDTVLNELSTGEVRSFYLSLAKVCLLGGKMPGARYAAQRALSLVGKGSKDDIRARLYLATAQIASDQTVDNLAVLTTLDAARLAPEDESLRLAAATVGTAILAEESSIGAAGDASNRPDDPAQRTIERARIALGAADDLLHLATRP